MKTDLEMGVSKVRYQIHKEEDDKDSKDAEYKEDIGIDTNENKRWRVLTKDEKRELENLEVLEAEGRRVYVLSVIRSIMGT